MPNTYINEVIFNGQTLMDLQNDTVTPDQVLAGATFHDRSGAPQTGSMIVNDVYDGLDSTSTTDALSANQGKILNDTKARWLYIISADPEVIYADLSSLNAGEGAPVYLSTAAYSAMTGQSNMNFTGIVSQQTDSTYRFNGAAGTNSNFRPVCFYQTGMSDSSLGSTIIIDPIKSIESIENGIAIVTDGDTHAAISMGQYVYVKNHSTITEGLYRALNNLTQNQPLQASMFQAESNGALNALGSRTGTLETKVSKRLPYLTVNLTNGSDTTYTFTENARFLATIVRTGTAGTGYDGLYIGYVSNTNSHLKTILEPTAGVSEISVSGRALTVKASATNMVLTVIPLSSMTGL